MICRGSGRLLPVRGFDEHHSAGQGIFPSAVIFVPGFQTLLIGGEFPGGCFDIDSGVPVPRLTEDKAVTVREGKAGKIVQILLKQQLIISDSVIMIVELQVRSVHWRTSQISQKVYISKKSVFFQIACLSSCSFRICNPPDRPSAIPPRAHRPGRPSVVSPGTHRPGSRLENSGEIVYNRLRFL